MSWNLKLCDQDFCTALHLLIPSHNEWSRIEQLNLFLQKLWLYYDKQVGMSLKFKMQYWGFHRSTDLLLAGNPDSSVQDYNFLLPLLTSSRIFPDILFSLHYGGRKLVFSIKKELIFWMIDRIFINIML